MNVQLKTLARNTADAYDFVALASRKKAHNKGTSSAGFRELFRVWAHEHPEENGATGLFPRQDKRATA